MKTFFGGHPKNDLCGRKCSHNGGFKVGGGRGKTKKGAPLMTSSFSANRDKHFDQA